MSYIIELHKAIQCPHLAEVQYHCYIWITAGYDGVAIISKEKDKAGEHSLLPCYIVLFPCMDISKKMGVYQHLE